MLKTPAQVKLEDGTLIRHNVEGYEGRIDSTTQIQSCFTAGGVLLSRPDNRQTFQYRVLVQGESLRRIAPAEDFQILDGVVQVACLGCRYTFSSKPGLAGKPGGRCQCGGWICPSCSACQDINVKSPCLKQRKRFVKNLAGVKKKKAD